MSERSRLDEFLIISLMYESVVSVGKFGTFPINLLLGRPYFLTFEIADKQNEDDSIRLRVVPVSELNAESLAEDTTASEGSAEPAKPSTDGFDIVGEDGSVIVKNNRLTVDDASRQTLTMDEIEGLKEAGTGSGKEIIEKIMNSHANLDEKTAFSLAKYTLRKTRKYMRRFTVLPMDVSMLAEYMTCEKEASRIMELREETIGLIGSWANVHYGGSNRVHQTELGTRAGGGRWLVVDETGGLVVASMAERMGVLYPQQDSDDETERQDGQTDVTTSDIQNDDSQQDEDVSMHDASLEDLATHTMSNPEPKQQDQSRPQSARWSKRNHSDMASNNTIHLIHANAQPNVSLLKYFGFDANNPLTTHPMNNHLKSLSWLQLLDPTADATYQEPEVVPQKTLEGWKSGKRGAYYKKRRRWERCRSIVDETREGGFDGLIVASVMDPSTILKHTVPLLRGSAHIVVYSPTIEPLMGLMDVYSRDRKSAYIAHVSEEGSEPPPEDDFPADPRLLLAPTLQTSRVRNWQVLPGRTHPLMTGRGGAEGYVFTARKVTPVDGKVEARGKFSKKRRVE